MALTLGVEGGVLEGPAAAEDEDARGEVDGKVVVPAKME